MKIKFILHLIIAGYLLFFFSCSKSDNTLSPTDPSKDKFLSETSSDKKGSSDDVSTGSTGTTSTSGSSSGSAGQQGGAKAGLVTAGEWNDLSNWNFWQNLFNEKDYTDMPSYWDIYTNNRISIKIENGKYPIINAKVELIRNDAVIWSCKTDNLGTAELWLGTFQKEDSVDLSNFSLKINGEIIEHELLFIKDGINKINLATHQETFHKVEISFIVDATGSMSDELEFLKEDLKSVIDSVKQNDANLNIFTSTVFYRDVGDEYIVRKSDFTNDLNTTISFINKQSANGGGDYPEAVHTALFTGVNELEWSESAKTRIAFLLLDAPPHYTVEIVKNIHNSTTDAANKGIKIIPITASGIDKKTEFLMRDLAILTNGTYVFITDDSGIGNDHLKPTVGDYKVELLNQLIVRLIKKYTD